MKRLLLLLAIGVMLFLVAAIMMRADGPRAISVADQLAVRVIQVSGLQAANRILEEKVKMLEAKVAFYEARDRLGTEEGQLAKHNKDLDTKHEQLRVTYGATPKDKLTFDLQWKESSTPPPR